jgi:UV DNA damage endonuclease
VVRLGLCCTFREAPIRFRTTTARYLMTRTKRERVEMLNTLALHNASALAHALDFCATHGIGAFRIESGILPMYTHPIVGWQLDGATGAGVARALRSASRRHRAIRLSLHPDPFVVPGSINPAVVASSLRELEYQAEVAALVGAEQVTLHGGGARGGKQASLERLAANLGYLSDPARSLIAIENDDRVFTVEDLLPLCERLGVPLVYDVHHHRCNPDRLSIKRATELAAATWGAREPWTHLSSPANGWQNGDPRPHADYIRVADVPTCWLHRRMTIDVEAKAKELAVLRLHRWFDRVR